LNNTGVEYRAEDKMRKTIFILTGFLFVFSLFQVPALAKNTPQEEKQIKMLKLLVLEGYNKGVTAVVDKFVAADYTAVSNGVTDEKTGPEAVKENINFNRENYNFKLSIPNIFSKGDWVTVHWKYQGTHKKSGKSVSFSGVFLAQFENGKMVKGWQHFDQQTLLTQLGYTLTPPDWAKKKED
jgi:hypothetical protein